MLAEALKSPIERPTTRWGTLMESDRTSIFVYESELYQIRCPVAFGMPPLVDFTGNVSTLWQNLTRRQDIGQGACP
jgi:hypothetical protein